MSTTDLHRPDVAVEPDPHASELRSLRLAVLLYLVVLTVKLAAYLITGIMALFAEAMHTVGDIFVTTATSASR